MKWMGTQMLASLMAAGMTAGALAAGVSIGVDADRGVNQTPVKGLPIHEPSQVVDGPGVFDATADLFEAPTLVPPHPPIDQIPPLPMPNSDELRPPGPMGEAQYHDLRTGQTHAVAVRREGLATSGQGGGFEGLPGMDVPEPVSRTFNTMGEINTVGSVPWRYNAKIVMRFVDTGGNSWWFVCSGAMQDAEVVLLAGHCVYMHDFTDSGGTLRIVNDWAADIFVYPGWDGNNLAFGTPGVIQTYGWARGAGLGSFTGWTVDRNFDWDLGIIQLDRAVGMLTGWFGWAWGGDCTARTYDNASFPAENCPISGLHNGRDMYYWFGRFDSCPGNQMQIDTSGGCFDAVWGGMSGSNAYYRVSNPDGTTSRFAHGACSNSNRSTRGRYAMLWESFVNFLNDSWRPGARGASFDLQALQCRLDGSTTLTAGQATGPGRVVITNPTNNNPASASYNVEWRLSSNDNLSTGDTLLADYLYSNIDFAAMQNRTFLTTSGGPLVPLGTPSGTYWLGVTIANGTDVNNGNNDSDLWDAQQVTVNGVADIDAGVLSVPGGTYFPGQSFSVSYDYANIGGDPSNSVTVDIRASSNTIISTGDWFLGDEVDGGLGGNSTWNDGQLVTLPASIPAGVYYVGMIASSSDDVDSSNNTAIGRLQITVVNCPVDLNNDGVLNFFDVSTFLSNFNGACTPGVGDFNNDGACDFFDVSAFLAAFNSGC